MKALLRTNPKFKSLYTLLGLDFDWIKQWEEETQEGVEKIKNDYSHKNLFYSGGCSSDINSYVNKRNQERKDEGRKRLLEGLGILPGWIALFISIISILISLFK